MKRLRRFKVALLAVAAWGVTACAAAPPEPVVPMAVPLLSRVTEIVHEPRPGENFGLPKDEAIKVLDPELRAFLDGVLRLYQEPGLIGDKHASLNALGLTVQRRSSSNTEGQPRPTYREDLAPTGVLSRPGWKGYVYYKGTEKNHTLWRMSMEFEISRKDAVCVNSRAVEGYVDEVFWYPVPGGTTHNPGWMPKDWDRHKQVGGVFSKRLTDQSPRIWMDFVRGCLVRVLISGNFLFKEMSDEHFYD